MTQVTVKFELNDGRELRCQYSYHTTPGFTSGLPEDSYPDETEFGDVDYYLDNEFVVVENLPKGLEVIAQAMREADANDKRFSYSEKEEYNGAEYY